MPEYSCRVTLRTANWEVSFENVARIDFTWFSYCQNTLLACVRAQVNSRKGNGDLLLTNFDFNALYTRISWSHLTHTFVWWRDWFHDLDGEVLSHLSTYERAFMQFIFAPISTEAKDLLISELPFLDVSQALASLGLWLLNFIYHHSVFLNPGIALFVQCYGFSMGMNSAPPWAQLTLRSFEKMRPLPPGIPLLRFLDDGLVLHRASETEMIKTCLQRMYPKDLPFAFEALGSARGVTFLDVRFISVEPLRTSVFWKSTHACAYMPWTTNVPRHIRESWIHAEFVRYLRICSDEKYYIICSNRLVDALVWLQYPQRVIRDKLIPWSERHKFLGVGARKSKNTRLIEPNHNGASLSQAENGVVDTHGIRGGGRESFSKTTHVLHAEHHGGVPMSWARACYVLKRRLLFMNHMNLFAIFKPLKNLKALFRKSARTTLQGSRDHA